MGGLVVLWFVLLVASQIWLSVRVGRSSIALALITLVLGFPGAFYTLKKYRGDAHASVTTPFFANVLFWGLFIGMGLYVVLPRLDTLNAPELPPVAHQAASAVQAAPASAPAAAVAAAPVAASVPASAAASAVDPAASEAAAALPAAADEFEAFSNALNEAGLKHTLTRLTAPAQRPAGVVAAANIAITPLAASAPAKGDLSVALFLCESAVACRNLAGSYMRQGGSEGRRVTQKGLLLLAMPAASASDADLTPATVASVFRRL